MSVPAGTAAPRPTLLYHGYAALTGLIGPLAYRRVAARLRGHGVPEARIRERLGHATLPRPDSGRLIWVHAASVGESLSVLALIREMSAQAPDLGFLITSGTATSARLLAQRMPANCRHQFAPLDTAAAVTRFLDHWHPDAALFVESELWPQMLHRARCRAIPLALVNARLSQRSLANWAKRPRTAAQILDGFALILTQNAEMAAALRALGADPARLRSGFNLKAGAAPLPQDSALIAEISTALAGRRLWVAASTHAGEEEILLRAHARLREKHPGLLLILVPRHPERSEEVSALITAQGLALARRSRAESPERADVYLADTLGELGNWYTLAPFVFLGGSLLPIGGHNPFEVAQAGLPVLSGPHVANFAESFAALDALGGLRTAPDAATIADRADRWLCDPTALEQARDGAARFIADQGQALGEIANLLLSTLEQAVKSASHQQQHQPDSHPGQHG